MGVATQIDTPSFFSDKTVNNTRFRNRLDTVGLLTHGTSFCITTLTLHQTFC